MYVRIQSYKRNSDKLPPTPFVQRLTSIQIEDLKRVATSFLVGKT